MKFRNPLRRNVATMLRRCVLVAAGRPVVRILNVPVARSITEACLAGSGSHAVYPEVCRISIVYWAGDSGIERHRRVSGRAPSHCWLTGLSSPAFGAGTESHLVQ